MFKNSAMKVVSPKKNGTVRENSLYHFIMDHMECELLSPYQTHCGKGERQVIYVEFPVENALINVLFPGFKLVGQHLSVDKHVIHEESPLSKNFSPAHCTLECDNEDASQRLVAHVYFNRYGQFSHCQAKVYSLARGIKGTEDGHLRVMSDKEKELILDHARPFQELFDKLLNQKAKIFIELYQASFHLDEELSQAIKEQNVPEAIQKADELMELTLKLTRYNDVEKDGRVAWLKHMLTQLKEGDLFRSIDHSSLEARRPERSEGSPSLRSERRDRNGKQPSPKPTKHEDSMLEIIHLVDKIVGFCADNATLGKCQQLIEMSCEFQQLDSAILALDVSSIEAVGPFIQQQRARLPISNSLVDYFKERVLAGDIDSVSVLYPTLVQRSNMYKVVTSLVLTIQKEADSEYCERLIKVADFFYEELEIYRSMMVAYNCIFHCHTAAQTGRGFLYEFFKNNSFLGFSMALRHGVPSDSIQMMHGTSLFNALQMLIMSYNINPDLRFIQKLIEHGAQMVLPIKKAIAVSPVLTKQFFKDKSELHLPRMELKENTGSESDLLFLRLSKIDNALSLASDMWSGKHPELIIELAQHVDPEYLILEAARLFDLTMFSTRFIPFAPKLSGRAFMNKAACNESTAALAARAQELTLPDELACCFLFYFSPPREPNPAERMLFTSASYLFTKAMEVLSVLSPNDSLQHIELRRIIKHLTECATHHKELKEYRKAVPYYRAAQMVYTMMAHPKMHDHQVMLQLFAFMAFAAKKINVAQPHNMLYLEAANFMMYLSLSLPENELELIQQTPVCAFLMDKIEELKRQTKNFGSMVPSHSLRINVN